MNCASNHPHVVSSLQKVSRKKPENLNKLFGDLSDSQFENIFGGNVQDR